MSSNKRGRPVSAPQGQQGSLFEEDYLIRSLGELGRRPDVALGELVANAWDAGASEVRIVIPSEKGDTLSVEDDGSGMTYDQFCKRWMTLGYNRLKHQGSEAEFPSERSSWHRRSYGRNGAGRHGLFCFADEYEVDTRREGEQCVIRVRLTSGKDPFEMPDVSRRPAEGHGTRLAVRVQQRLPEPDRVRDALSSRFLFDPQFRVFVNGVSIPLTEQPGLLDKSTLEIEEVTLQVVCVEGDAGKAKYQSGVAFWVGQRLVGEPSWVVGDEQLIDGRTRPGRRLTFIVSTDDLFDEVLPDWTAFRESELIHKVRAGVRDHVKEILGKVLASRVNETRGQVLQEHRDQLRDLEPGARAEVVELVEGIAKANPLMPATTISAVVEEAVKVKRSSAVQALIERIMILGDEDAEGMKRILDEWSVRDALTVLDEIGRRIKTVEAIEKLIGQPHVDEVHVIHPLITQARWLFGPEFESPTYASNLTIRKAVQKVFGASVAADAFLNEKKRPDLLFLPDATISAVATEDYDVPSGIARLRSVFLVELKKGDATIGRDAMNQADGYVQDILTCGLLDGDPYVYAFVVGHRVDEKTLRVKKVGEPERGRIEAHSFSQLVRTANARLFRIRDRVEERYPEQGRAVVERIWGDSVEAKNLGLFEPAAPQSEAGEPS
jgi:hypothetical protein